MRSTKLSRRARTRTTVALAGVCLLVLLALILFMNRGPRAFTPADAQAVETVISEQQAAWNAGNLEAFMSGYWHSPDMTFYSGGDIRRGWDEAFERYRQRYQGEGKEMGRLTFSDLLIEGAGPYHAWVRGRYLVEFSDGKSSSGLFTLVFRRLPEGWRIIHDHTSAPEKPPA